MVFIHFFSCKYSYLFLVDEKFMGKKLYNSEDQISLWEKLHFIILNYAPDYTLHPKLLYLSYFASRCYFCYYVWWMLLHDKHMLLILGGTNLKNWNTHLQNQLKQRPIFSISLCLPCMPLLNSDSSQNLRFHPTQLTHHLVPLSVWHGWDNPLYFFPCTCTEMEEI